VLNASYVAPGTLYCRELVPGLPPELVGDPPASPGWGDAFAGSLSGCGLFAAGCPDRFRPVVGAPDAVLPN
jgi:hypothetical protein